MFRPCLAGNQVLQHRGPKPQRGHICKYNMRCIQQPRGANWNGGYSYFSYLSRMASRHCSHRRWYPGQHEKLMNSLYIAHGTKRCNVHKNDSRYCVSLKTSSSLCGKRWKTQKLQMFTTFPLTILVKKTGSKVVSVQQISCRKELISYFHREKWSFKSVH